MSSDSFGIKPRLMCLETAADSFMALELTLGRFRVNLRVPQKA